MPQLKYISLKFTTRYNALYQYLLFLTAIETGLLPPTGAIGSLHLPSHGIHQYCHHLQRHPQSWNGTAGHAHAQVFLLGYKPTGPQRDHTQGSR